MSGTDVAILVLVGLVAGGLGGLLGIGGSVIMIPVLTLGLTKSQHLAQAVAMIVNIAVALPSAYRHQRAGAVRWDMFIRFLPFAAIAIVAGVHLSDQFHGEAEALLQRIFGCFLLYVVTSNILQMQRRASEPDLENQNVNWVSSGIVGSITGGLAGLLGIGGGVVAVPMMQRICRLPLRQCIATSSAVMVITAIIGAIRKNMTLATHVDAAGDALQVNDSLMLAACLVPTAMIGGFIGARLTHKLPLKWVRIVFLVLLSYVAINMIFH